MSIGNLSAQKRERQSITRNVNNQAIKNLIKTYYKKIMKGVQNNDKNELSGLLKEYYSILDKAVKKNILHINNVSRKKTAIMRIINLMGNNKQEKVKENA